MNKPVLIIQLRPEDDTSDNEYQAFLKYGEFEANQTQRLRIEKNGIPDDLRLDDYSAIIVGGSPFDISTPDDKKSAIQHKIEADFNTLLTDVIKQDFPFLGACSGNGLLGSFLGAPISPRYGEAVGCVSLDITEQGKQDPLLQGFPEQVNVMLGHKDACDIVPEDAILLISGQQCPVQMFRVGNNVYATQFHPEGDADGFSLRIEAYKHHGYFDPAEAELLTQVVNQASTPYAQHLLKRFVRRYFKQQGQPEPSFGLELLQLDWQNAKPLARPLRKTVFIDEQQVPESEEWDDEDDTATHIIAFYNGKAVATARLSQQGKIGRMAVLKDYRKQGIGSAIVAELLKLAKQRGLQQVQLGSQTHAQEFYDKQGFKAYGDEFIDAGIPHIAMQRDL